MRGRDHARRQAIAAQDAAEDVDQHGAHVLVGKQNAESVLDLLFAGAAADVEEVRGTATGVVQAARNQKVTLPIVLRLEGTNVEEGRRILKDSGLNFIVAETMKDAAEKVVAAAGKA